MSESKTTGSGERGLRPYEYSLSLTGQFYFCGAPFRLDVSPHCGHSCAYCFRTARGGNSGHGAPIASPSRIAKKLARARDHKARLLDVSEELLRRRMPVHFGGLSDPFSSECLSLIALDLLRLLLDAEHPVVISTKNTPRLLRDDALSIISGSRRVVLQTSLTSLDARRSARMEPLAPPPLERLTALGALSRLGLPVVCRLQPVFPSLVPELVTELVPSLESAGVRHVTVECLKVPVERGARRLLESLDPPMASDVARMVDGPRLRVGREWVYPTRDRWDLLQPLITAIRKAGMTYGAADYGLYHLGDTDDCCGISALPEFAHWNKATITHAIRSHIGGVATFESVRNEWGPEGTIRRFMNSRSRIEGEQTALSYLRAKWNRAGTTNAPDSYLGVKSCEERDAWGDVVYRVGDVDCGVAK